MKHYDRLKQLLDEELGEFVTSSYEIEHSNKGGIDFFFVNISLSADKRVKNRLRFLVVDKVIQLLYFDEWVNISRLDYSIKHFWIALLS